MGLSRAKYEMFNKLNDMIKPNFCIRDQKIIKTIVCISVEFISPLLQFIIMDAHFISELVLIEFLYVHSILL